MTAVLKRSYFFGNGCCFILEGLGAYKKRIYPAAEFYSFSFLCFKER